MTKKTVNSPVLCLGAPSKLLEFKISTVFFFFFFTASKESCTHSCIWHTPLYPPPLPINFLSLRSSSGKHHQSITKPGASAVRTLQHERETEFPCFTQHFKGLTTFDIFSSRFATLNSCSGFEMLGTWCNSWYPGAMVRNVSSGQPRQWAAFFLYVPC